MKAFVGVAILAVFLFGCGGGGGGGTVWPTTAIGTSESVTGALTTQSVQAPDGTYVNFYTVNIPSPTMLNISLESVDFDTYLFLFQGAALGEPDLNNWVTNYEIAENDDLDASTTNSFLSQQLAAGTYVIAVNSFSPATGNYVLATSINTLTASRQYVQFRAFEDPAGNLFRAWIDYKDNGALLQPGDLLTARLYDPTGTEVIPATLQFVSNPYTVAVWVPGSGTFGSIATDGDSAFLFDLSNYADLAAGLYTFEVDPASGGTLTTSVDYPGKTVLPAVASATMTSQWNADGSLTLGWTVPAGVFDQYRVVLTDAGGNGIFYGRVLPGVTAVTLQEALVDQITLFSQVAPGATINWTMQTRNYIGDSNYARSISDPVALTWP